MATHIQKALGKDRASLGLSISVKDIKQLNEIKKSDSLDMSMRILKRQSFSKKEAINNIEVMDHSLPSCLRDNKIDADLDTLAFKYSYVF